MHAYVRTFFFGYHILHEVCEVSVQRTLVITHWVLYGTREAPSQRVGKHAMGDRWFSLCTAIWSSIDSSEQACLFGLMHKVLIKHIIHGSNLLPFGLLLVFSARLTLGSCQGIVMHSMPWAPMPWNSTAALPSSCQRLLATVLAGNPDGQVRYHKFVSNRHTLFGA